MVVVIESPAVDHPASFLRTQEDFPIQEFVAKRTVEGLNVTVFPRTPLGHKQGFHFGLFKPTADGLGDELRAIVAANVLWCTSHRKQVLQDADHVVGSERASHFDRQAFAGVFVYHSQQPDLTTVFGPIGQEIVRPDMVLVFGPVTHAAILAATGETSFAMLFSRDLHVLSLPKTVDSLLVYVPVACNKQTMNTLGPEAWTLPGQSSHLTKQLRFIIWSTRLVSLGVTRLIEDAASTALRYLPWPQTATYFGDHTPTTFGAYQFPFAASFRISMSSACSATIFFNRAFSFSRALSCLAISGCMPPYFCRQR